MVDGKPEAQKVDPKAQPEQKEESDFDWGEEIPEDYEDEEEQEYETLNKQYLINIRVHAENKTEEITIDKMTALKINQVSMAANNTSNSKHILEIAYGPQLEERHVVARLIPGQVETLVTDVEIPPKKVD